MPNRSGQTITEEERILEVYARRPKTSLYSVFNAGHRFMVQEQERAFLSLLVTHHPQPFTEGSVLEVGCGNGYWLRGFIRWGAHPENMTGIDLIEERIQEARRLSPQSVKYECANAANLGFPDGSFDIVLQSTVFTSILDPAMRQAVANEMLRVLKPGGSILWFDYHINNPRNPDVRAVKRRELISLFPDCSIVLRHVTLAPPISRFVARYSWLACCILSEIPFLSTHYAALIRKRDSAQ